MSVRCASVDVSVQPEPSYRTDSVSNPTNACASSTRSSSNMETPLNNAVIYGGSQVSSEMYNPPLDITFIFISKEIM